MAHSSLLGLDPADEEPAGRDNAALGPSDSSDSGSDMMGVGEQDDDDPALPVDVALREDSQRPMTSDETLVGAGSDRGGSGERRSAGSDAGRREAADISVDRIIEPDGGETDLDDDEDPDLAFVDRAEAGDPLESEDADAPDFDVDVDASDAMLKPRPIAASATLPGRPNPEPDAPGDTGGDDAQEPPDEDQDDEHRKPGKV